VGAAVVGAEGELLLRWWVGEVVVVALARGGGVGDVPDGHWQASPPHSPHAIPPGQNSGTVL